MSASPKRLREVRDGRVSVNSINPSLIIIPVSINGSSIHAMVDTGATHTLITRSLLLTLPHPPVQSTTVTAAFLGDASTTIAIRGVVRLCIYINRIPTFVSVYVVDSLNIDLILGMDWCSQNNVQLHVGEKTLRLQHSRFGCTQVPFLDSIDIPARLAQSITLLPHHEHIIRLYTPISSADSVCFTPANLFCRKRHIVMPEAVLKVNRFHTYMLVYNSSNTSRILKKHTTLGNMNYFPPSAVSTSIVTCSSSVNFPHLGSLPIPSVPNSLPNTPSPEVTTVLEQLVCHLSDAQQKSEFAAILHRHQRVFDLSSHSIAKTTIPHVIVTGDHPPISVRPYYRTLAQRKDLQQEVDKLLLDNIIRPSISPWSSPVILKKKPDGTFRFLIDFRRLNSVTKKDVYLQPSAEELLLRLSGH